MTRNWLRRTLVLAACASAALLSACGSSTVESAITPTRIVSFGDAFSDLGYAGSRYTVNDGSTNIWAQQFASGYGRSLETVSAGGTSYARGNARVALSPDAAGVAATLTLTQQIDAFLAADHLGSTDMVLINGGPSDVIAQVAAVQAGSLSEATAVANAQAAGRALGDQVRRLVSAGGRYVVVTGSYDLARTPWAIKAGLTGVAGSTSSAFNTALLVAIVDLGANVRYIDAAYYVNLLVNSPNSFSLYNSADPVCTSVDSGNGIGIGAGQVNAALCNTSTLLSGADHNRYVFADPVHLTPAAHRLFGTHAYDQVRSRW